MNVLRYDWVSKFSQVVITPVVGGYFGGTFDPPHNGHLVIAEYVRHRLGLNKVIFVPSWISPHKQDRRATSAADRLEMLRLTVERVAGLEVSDIEVRRGGVSYTIDTLRHLSSETRAELHLLIGADNFVDFDTWHDWQAELTRRLNASIASVA